MEPSKWSAKRKMSVVGGAFAIAVSAGFITAASGNPGDYAQTFTPAGQGELPSKKFSVPHGTTADGRSYGSMLDQSHGVKPYDLIWVESDNGKFGFIDRVEADSIIDDVAPEDAPALKAKVDAGEVKLPVFDRDGVTQIDTFTIGPSKDPRFKRYTSEKEFEEATGTP